MELVTKKLESDDCNVLSENKELTLADLPDDMLRAIGIILCPDKVYHVWNVLARLNTSFSERMSDPPLKAFQTIVECEDYNQKVVIHYLCDRLHRDNDLPAIIRANGTQLWYQHGELHRDNLPAIINANGVQEWYQHGKLHRDNNLPAVVGAVDFQMWYQHGELHRDNDLPAEILTNGHQKWYQHGKLHRDNDLPAVIDGDGTQEWRQNGKLHRDNDLPAIIHPDGTQKWYRYGKLYRETISCGDTSQ